MQNNPTAATTLNKDDLIVVTGAGGFIAGSLVKYFHDSGFTCIRAVDKKPLPNSVPIPIILFCCMFAFGT